MKVFVVSVVAASFLALVGPSPSPANAAGDKKGQTGGDDQKKEAARKRYDEGVKLYDLGHFEEAIREFEAAYQIVPTPLLLYNLAQSHRRLNHLDKAKELYRTYLRKSPDAANRADVEQRIAALETTTGPPDQVVGSKDAENQKPIAEAAVVRVPEPSAPPPPPPVPPVAPVVPEAPVPAASAAPVPAPVPEATAVASGSPTDAASSGGWWRTGGLITAGAGVVLLAVGTASGFQTSKLSEQARNSPVYDPAKVADAKSSETAQWVFLGAGAAAVAAGAGLYYLGLRESDSGAPAVALIPGRDSVSLITTGRF